MAKVVARKSDGKQIEWGRPSLFTPERVQKILDLVGVGNYLGTAAEASGIAYNTLRNWVKIGRDHDLNCGLELDECLAEQHPEAAFREFMVNLKRAESTAEANQVEYISKDKSWIARMTLLERRHPDRWGKRAEVKHKVSGTVTNKIKLSADQKLALAQALTQQAAIEAPQSPIETKLEGEVYVPVIDDKDSNDNKS